MKHFRVCIAFSDIQCGPYYLMALAVHSFGTLGFTWRLKGQKYSCINLVWLSCMEEGEGGIRSAEMDEKE